MPGEVGFQSTTKVETESASTNTEVFASRDLTPFKSTISTSKLASPDSIPSFRTCTCTIVGSSTSRLDFDNSIPLCSNLKSGV